MVHGTTKRKSLEAMPRWLKNLPEAEDALGAFRQLRELLRKNDRSNVSWWNDVGIRINRLQFHYSARYGTAFMPTLAKALFGRDYQPGKESSLYLALRVTKKLGFMGIASLPPEITFQHVVHLLSVNERNTKTMQGFVDLCVRRRLSAAQLAREIQNDRGGRRGGGGRRAVPRKTTSAVVALQDLQSAAKCWGRFDEQSFYNDGVLFRPTRHHHADEALAKELKRAFASLQEIRVAVTREREVLRKLASKLGVCLGKGMAAETKGVRGRNRRQRKG
jgi:hypothetical protein